MRTSTLEPLTILAPTVVRDQSVPAMSSVVAAVAVVSLTPLALPQDAMRRREDVTGAQPEHT